jgi:hypothetical protein
MAVAMKVTAYRDATPCSLAGIHKCLSDHTLIPDYNNTPVVNERKDTTLYGI